MSDTDTDTDTDTDKNVPASNISPELASPVIPNGLQLEQLANKNLITIRIKWLENFIDDEVAKDNVISQVSNIVLHHKGTMISPLKIENYEYLSDDKRLEVIKENNYEFVHGSQDLERSYNDNSRGWLFDIVLQADFRKKYSLDNCISYITNVLKINKHQIEKWSITINHHALTHPENLFIGGISKNITISNLIDIFKQFGPIVSIKLIHDKLKENDIGYGFVSYQLGSQASDCIAALNKQSIEGSTIFINYHVDRKEREILHWNQVKDTSEDKDFKCLFIGNLPKETDDNKLVNPEIIIDLIKNKLEEKFPDFTINSFYFPNDSTNNYKDSTENLPLKGYGFIKLKNHGEVMEVIKIFNGFNWFGSILVVNKAVQNRVQNNSQNYISSNLNKKPIVSSRGITTKNQQMPQYTKNIYSAPCYDTTMSNNKVLNIYPLLETGPKSIKNPVTNICSEFPSYETPTVMVNPYMNSLPIPLNNQQESNLYVKYIPLDWSDQDLNNFYQRFGSIISAKVITFGGSRGLHEDLKISSSKDETLTDTISSVGTSKGYGFVCFENPIDAARAIFATHGFLLSTSSKLSVSFANKKKGSNAIIKDIEANIDNSQGFSNRQEDNRSSEDRSNNKIINNGLPVYNKKFMNALLQHQTGLLATPHISVPPTAIQSFPVYTLNGRIPNPFVPVSLFGTMPYQYPRS